MGARRILGKGARLLRPLLIAASQSEAPALLKDWRWLVPEGDTPLFISVFGDWVFGHPDGSLWVLSVLEGTYARVAQDAAEFNRLTRSAKWLEDTLLSGWQPIAAAHGLVPSEQECLGWTVHPLVGGKFEVANLKVFSMRVYQALMGQLHRQLRRSAQQG